MRRWAPCAVLALLVLAGCGAGGGDKIEPESKGASGSPILNQDKAPKAPTDR